jgi:hypothetical protein
VAAVGAASSRVVAAGVEVCQGCAVSVEDVELVRRLQPGPEVDIAAMFRDDATAGLMLEAFTPLFHPDCQIGGDMGTDIVDVAGAGGSGDLPHAGLERLRAAWLQWLEPWATYRTQIEDVIDTGDHVVVLAWDFARLEHGGPEVSLKGASVWTMRDGKVARAEFYSNREEGLRAAGLAA